jgi:hypothetical protein
MIGNVDPVAHVSPYKRIDVLHPGRKPVITKQEVISSGNREPDAEVYSYDFYRECWTLKDGM